MNKILFPSSQDKWIAVGMWVVSLILLFFGSSTIALSLNYVQSFNLFFQYAKLSLPIGYWIAVAAPVFAIVFFIVRAWVLFFRFTRLLFLTLGKAIEGSETGSVFYSFLYFHNMERESSLEIQPKAETATGSVISSLIWMIGLSYLMAVIEVMVLTSGTFFM